MTFDEAGLTFDSKENFDETSTAPVAVNKFDTGVQFNTGAQFDAKKAPSVSGTPIVIYPGWPQQDNLAADLAERQNPHYGFSRRPRSATRRATPNANM